jgi:predicted extracellular nuclease
MRKQLTTIFVLIAMLLPMVVGVTPALAAEFVSIHDIQYTTDPSGDSPYEGETVTTQGVVTAFFYDGGNRYTFIQDGTGPWNGLLLYKPNGYVNVGDLLEVTGTVSDRRPRSWPAGT